MRDLLHSAKRFELEHLQIVTFIWEQLNAVPDEDLQGRRDICADTAGQIARIVEHDAEPPFA